MSKKTTIEQIRILVEERGLKLLSSGYVDRRSPLKIFCPVHGEFETKYINFRLGNICSKCGYSNGAKAQTLKIEEVQSRVRELGYEPLFSEYKNAKQKLLISCPTHGEFEASFDNLSQGKKCAKCSVESIKEKIRLPVEEVHRRITEKGCTPLFDEYSDCKSQIKVSCPTHGMLETTLEAFTHRNGCAKCSHHRSDSQEEVFDFIKAYYPDVISNTRNIIPPLEIDIFIPSLKLAIEYNGIYWHSDKFKKDKNYHLNKTIKANKNGIRLITIFEDEWRDRKDQVKGFLLSALSKNSKKIYARNCEVRVVEKTNAVAFLDDNHIQGSTVFQASIGLYHNDELVGLITGNKHHRQGHDSKFVLNRLVFKRDYSIAGGSSRLLKYLIKYAKDHGFNEIISWSDNRWSEGNVYKSLGFTLEEVLIPDYSYVKGPNRMSKQSCQKKLLTKKGAVGDSESEMAKSLGYNRIWDCGKIRWKLPLR